MTPAETTPPVHTAIPAHAPSRPRRIVATSFCVAATLEAVTWAALLIGMFLKYVTQTTPLGVTIAGTAHGYAFLLYLLTTTTAAITLRWRWTTTLLAILAAIPPLATLPLEHWMRRTGKLTPPARNNSTAELAERS